MSLVRQALGRGVLLGLTFVALMLVLGAATWLIVRDVPSRAEAALFLGTTFLAGFVVTPITIIERGAASFSESYRRDALAVLATAIVAYLAFVVLYLQLVYFSVIVRSGATPHNAAKALQEVLSEVKFAFEWPSRLLPPVLLVAMPAAFVPVGRLRKWPLGWQLVFVFLGSFVTSATIAVLAGKYDLVALALGGAFLAAFTPVLFRWADALDAWRARQVGEDLLGD